MKLTRPRFHDDRLFNWCRRATVSFVGIYKYPICFVLLSKLYFPWIYILFYTANQTMHND